MDRSVSTESTRSRSRPSCPQPRDVSSPAIGRLSTNVAGPLIAAIVKVMPRPTVQWTVSVTVSVGCKMGRVVLEEGVVNLHSQIGRNVSAPGWRRGPSEAFATVDEKTIRAGRAAFEGIDGGSARAAHRPGVAVRVGDPLVRAHRLSARMARSGEARLESAWCPQNLPSSHGFSTPVTWL